MTSPLPKTLVTLAALTIALPLSATLVAGAVVVGGARALARKRRPRTLDTPRKTVLVSGGKMTKALQLARSFNAAGHRVILAESRKYAFTAHRFSRAVDRFYALPEPTAPDYVDALIAVIATERVDVYVPVCSPVASLCDAAAKPRLEEHCEVVHAGPETIRKLDDKYVFAQTAAALGLRVPKSMLVTDPATVLAYDFAAERRAFILKSIRYDSVRRLDLTRLPRATPEATEAFVRSLPISAENPWVMQEFIPGTEYCTHGTFRKGELRVHCCCESSAFQVNYRNVDVPAIEAWVRRFGEALHLTGQASFDFIRADDDGAFYAIECNPRTHSAITMFYDHPDVARAYLGGELAAAPIRPLPASRPTYWFYHELWRLATSLGSWARLRERLHVLASGKDAVLDWGDPLPFLMLYHCHIPLLLLRDVRERRGWLRIDCNIGKLVQAGGD
jgi:predicted ATP-grasp superfamily ATP-dependent carboligase